MKTCLLILLICTMAVQAEAQVRVTPFPEGTRVRVAAPEVFPSRITGRVAEMRSDTLFLMRGRNDVAVPLTAVRSLEISRGRDRLRGGAIGVLTGAVAGLAWGAILDAGCTDYCFGVVVGPLLFAPIVGVGYALVGTERWERIPVDQIFIRP